MKGLHFCIIAMEYPPEPVGGIGSFSSELAQGLIEKGDRVTVIVPAQQPLAGVRMDATLPGEKVETEQFENLTVVRWTYQSPAALRWRPGFYWHRWKFRKFLYKLHKELEFDIIECQDLYGPLPFGGLKNVATVIRHHSTSLFLDQLQGTTDHGDPLIYWSERSTIRNTPFQVAVSRYVANGVSETFSIPTQQLTVIPCGIDTDLFSPSNEIGPEEGRIVFVNSVTPRKGVRELCQAFARVHEVYPKASLKLIGRDDRPMTDGTLYKDHCLEGLSQAVVERITFSGAIPRTDGLVPALQQAHLCCFPSHMETFGLAPVEAMAVGKPVIYMNHGPGPEIITHGENGLLCNTAQPEDIAAKILMFLRDSELANKCGTAARKRALDFSRPQWIERNREYYAQVIEAFRKGRPLNQ